MVRIDGQRKWTPMYTLTNVSWESCTHSPKRKNELSIPDHNLFKASGIRDAKLAGRKYGFCNASHLALSLKRQLCTRTNTGQNQTPKAEEMKSTRRQPQTRLLLDSRLHAPKSFDWRLQGYDTFSTYPPDNPSASWAVIRPSP